MEVKICDKIINIDNESVLFSKYVCYVIEFNDLRYYVGISKRSLRTTLFKIICNSKDESSTFFNSKLSEKLREVDSFSIFLYNKTKNYIKNKYDAIENYNTLYPFGYNTCIIDQWCDNEEREYIKYLKQNNKYFIDNSVNANTKSVVSIDLISNKITGEYDSISEASRLNGGLNQSYLSRCCNGKIKSAYGVAWKFKKDI